MTVLLAGIRGDLDNCHLIDKQSNLIYHIGCLEPTQPVNPRTPLALESRDGPIRDTRSKRGVVPLPNCHGATAQRDFHAKARDRVTVLRDGTGWFTTAQTLGPKESPARPVFADMNACAVQQIGRLDCKSLFGPIGDNEARRRLRRFDGDRRWQYPRRLAAATLLPNAGLTSDPLVLLVFSIGVSNAYQPEPPSLLVVDRQKGIPGNIVKPCS